eukprot:1498463-Rhodomonas_salina.1
MICGATLSWTSTRQAVVALSSSEAEFYAASAAGCDVVYTLAILEQLGFLQREPTIVFEDSDNWACIHMSASSQNKAH